MSRALDAALRGKPTTDDPASLPRPSTWRACISPDRRGSPRSIG